MTSKSVEQLRRELTDANERLAAWNRQRETTLPAIDLLMIDRNIKQVSDEIAQLETQIEAKEKGLRKSPDPIPIVPPVKLSQQLDGIAQAEAGPVTLQLGKTKDDWDLTVQNTGTAALSRLNISFANTGGAKVRAGAGPHKTDVPEISRLDPRQQLACPIHQVTLDHAAYEELPHEQMVNLRDELDRSFALPDLRQIVFRISCGSQVDWDQLAGHSKGEKIVSLLNYWRMRRCSYSALLQACAIENQAGAWASIKQEVRQVYPLRFDVAYQTQNQTKRHSGELELRMIWR